MIGIYKITNTINGKVYIGQSVNIAARWRAHRNANDDYVIHKAFRKYGIENFEFDVLEECEIALLNEREKYWINFYNSWKNGYNETPGGDFGGYKLQPQELMSIIQDLKEDNLSITDIAHKYCVHPNTITGINTGKHWIQEDIEYPIRKLHVAEKSYCICCGIEISKGATYCRPCWVKTLQTVERPSPDMLVQLIAKKGFAGVGAMYGVNGNTIKKWCKAYGLPYLKKDIVFLATGQKPKEMYHIKQTKVYQYTKDTHEYIAVYNTAKEAAIALGNEQYAKHIGEVCSGSRKSAYGYYWERK